MEIWKMEKLSIIFSVLAHDYKFMGFFWLFITMPVGIWHIFFFHRKKSLTEKELIEISLRFSGIDLRYMIFSVIWILGVMVFPFITFSSRLDHWSLINHGIRFYPLVVWFTAGYGIYQGLFALLSGVYPMTRTLSYVHGDISLIRSVAKYQILISIVALIIVVLFFFATT
jgi:hypothetical protein